jgi:hypothetical protein
MGDERNEVGTAPPRGRPTLRRNDAERELSSLAGQEVRLPENAVVTGGPTSCPACGSENLMWGCDPRPTRSRDEIHPLVWDDEQWMADSFMCQECHAGWIEPDGPEEITWVRPYWRL